MTKQELIDQHEATLKSHARSRDELMGHLLTALQFGGRLTWPSHDKDGNPEAEISDHMVSVDCELLFDLDTREEIETTISALRKSCRVIEKNQKNNCEQLGWDVAAWGGLEAARKHSSRNLEERINSSRKLLTTIHIAVCGLETRLAVLDQEAEQAKKEAA